MKRLLIIIVLFFIAGCGEITLSERQVWSDFFQSWSELSERNLDREWQYNQIQIVPVDRLRGPTPDDSTYWQEKYYRNKVLGRN